MSFTTDLDATENTIYWPACENDAPKGWHWGRFVNLGSRGNAYYLIRDSDDATLIAIQGCPRNPDRGGSRVCLGWR